MPHNCQVMQYFIGFMTFYSDNRLLCISVSVIITELQLAAHLFCCVWTAL